MSNGTRGVVSVVHWRKLVFDVLLELGAGRDNVTDEMIAAAEQRMKELRPAGLGTDQIPRQVGFAARRIQHGFAELGAEYAWEGRSTNGHEDVLGVMADGSYQLFRDGAPVGQSYMDRDTAIAAYRAVAFDEAKREKLLSEGIAMSPVSSAPSVYSYLDELGYHFPEWLVTDYVLSLATKPLVILSGISGTGKTKMAQLVSRHVAPDVVVLEAMDEVPVEEPGGWLHSVGLSELKHRVAPVPKRVQGLFENLPEGGKAFDIDLRYQGQSFEGRLTNYTAPGSSPQLEIWWKKSFAEIVARDFQIADHLRYTPENGGDKLTIDVAHIPSRREERPEPSTRVAFLSVRPDWTDNRGLLGYYNPLLQKYQATELLRLLLRAHANPDEPHFAVLDEMNLAKVEYYFSDFLSAIEAETEMALHDADEELLLNDFENTPVPARLKVPSNVFFTGTVNVDETTYMFSPKVLDRANTLEFNEVDLERYGTGEGFDSDGFRLRADVSVEQLLGAYHRPSPADWHVLSDTYKDRLRELHSIMELHNLHFGYRVANEIARYLNLTAEYVGMEALDIAFDLQVLQKVLPKLAGSRAKLEKPLVDMLILLDALGAERSAAKVRRMIATLQSVGFVSFVE